VRAGSGRRPRRSPAASTPEREFAAAPSRSVVGISSSSRPDTEEIDMSDIALSTRLFNDGAFVAGKGDD
jgi:hypothetical protein